MNRQRRGAERRGAYTAEFALMIPTFLLTVFACFELSRYAYIRQAIDNTAYEAAREGILTGATADEVIARGEALLNGYGLTSATVTVDPETIDRSTMDVSVTIAIDMGPNIWSIPALFLTDPVMRSSITLAHENAALLVPEDSGDADELNENDEPLDT